MAFPVLVDTVHMVVQTAVLVVKSGHAAHLPDRSLASSELADILAHTFDRDSVVVEATLPPFAGSLTLRQSAMHNRTFDNCTTILYTRTTVDAYLAIKCGSIHV